ncbi:MAG TPA: hypothetical protein VHM24_11020 [Gemmatimonadaceae bacterium]|nr:hypothetical protein [Gemmatimonadaceae bacterium]
MRHWVAVVGIAFLAVSFPASAQSHPKPGDAWFGPDKVKHFLIAGFVESVAFAGAQGAGANRNVAKSAALAAVTAASFGREFHDRRTKRLFSIRDLVWDAMGAGAALLVVNRTQR